MASSSARPPMPSFKPPPLPQETDDLVRQCSRSPSPSPYTMPLDNAGHDDGARGRPFLDVPKSGGGRDASPKKNFESPYAPFKVYPHTFNTPPSDSPPYSRTPSPPLPKQPNIESTSRTPSPKPIVTNKPREDDVPIRGQTVITTDTMKSELKPAEILDTSIPKLQKSVTPTKLKDSPSYTQESKATPTDLKRQSLKKNENTPSVNVSTHADTPVQPSPTGATERQATPTDSKRSLLNQHHATPIVDVPPREDTSTKMTKSEIVSKATENDVKKQATPTKKPTVPKDATIKTVTKSPPPSKQSETTPTISHSPVMSKESRQEVKKILENKSNIMEKASQRASALNLTRLCPTLVFATGSSTLRSVRLEELQVNLVILATTSEELESGKNLPTLEGVAYKSIVLNENKDNDKEIESYLHNAADWIHNLQKGVAMVHAPDSGAFKKGTSLNDSRRGEGFAAALCAAYFIKHQDMTAQEALDNIKSRRPEAKPSTSLVLQLMDFADKIRFNKKKPKSTLSSPSSKMSKFCQMDWKSQVKVAIPLSIYFMLMSLVLKMMYEAFFESISSENESNEELVCY